MYSGQDILDNPDTHLLSIWTDVNIRKAAWSPVGPTLTGVFHVNKTLTHSWFWTTGVRKTGLGVRSNLCAIYLPITETLHQASDPTGETSGAALKASGGTAMC